MNDPTLLVRPVILSSRWQRGARISRVLRADGSAFTVTVPRNGMDDPAGRPAPQARWISDDTGCPELSTVGCLRLAAVAGVPRAADQLISR